MKTAKTIIYSERFPVYTEASQFCFVPGAPTEKVSYHGHEILTAPLAFNVVANLLHLTKDDRLVENGVHDMTDCLFPRMMKVRSIWFRGDFDGVVGFVKYDLKDAGDLTYTSMVFGIMSCNFTGSIDGKTELFGSNVRIHGAISFLITVQAQTGEMQSVVNRTTIALLDEHGGGNGLTMELVGFELELYSPTAVVFYQQQPYSL